MSPIDKLEVELAAVIGERCLTLGDVLRLRRGAFMELNRPATDHLTLTVGGCVIGEGQLRRSEGGALQAVVMSAWRSPEK